MAGLAISASIGDSLILKDCFLSHNVNGEWKGNPLYQSAHFVQLPISGQRGQKDFAATLPRDMLKFQPTKLDMSVDEVFALQISYLAQLEEREKKESVLKAEREKRRTEMERALKDSTDERERRRLETESSKKKLEDQQTDLITELKRITNESEQTCKDLLQRSQWDLSQAASSFFQDKAQAAPKRDVTIVFHIQSPRVPPGSKHELTCSDSKTVFELFQHGFMFVPDQSQEFEMRLNDVPLNQTHYTKPLHELGLKAGTRHNIVIRQD